MRGWRKAAREMLGVISPQKWRKDKSKLETSSTKVEATKQGGRTKKGFVLGTSSRWQA